MAFGTLDVEHDSFAVREADFDFELIFGSEKFPVEKIDQLPTVDPQEFRTRGEAQVGADRIGSNRLNADHGRLPASNLKPPALSNANGRTTFGTRGLTAAPGINLTTASVSTLRERIYCSLRIVRLRLQPWHVTL